LGEVDFWTPQFYGAQVPERVDQMVPISSPADVQRVVNRARAIGKPFYAGLAAYGWALLYNGSGDLISVRGDLDPAEIAGDRNLELIDLRRFDGASEWRYTYRARAENVIDGLVMQTGDVLVVDVPTAESLRESARAVREWAGKKLLGICVFRLPAKNDPATLTLTEVAAALSDRKSNPDFEIMLRADEQPRAWLLQITNKGTSGAMGRLQIDLPIKPEALESVSTDGASWSETLCQVFDGQKKIAYRPCSQNRATVLRIAAHGLRPNQTLSATLYFKTTLPEVVPVSIETQTDAGVVFTDRRDIPVYDEQKR
jgi:hypothetical protein